MRALQGFVVSVWHRGRGHDAVRDTGNQTKPNPPDEACLCLVRVRPLHMQENETRARVAAWVWVMTDGVEGSLTQTQHGVRGVKEGAFR